MSDKNLEMGHNPDDPEDRLNFINELPMKSVFTFFNEIKAQLNIKEKEE